MDPPFITSHLTSSQWQQKLLPIEEDDCSDEQYDSIEEAVMQGVYLLGTKGCTYENIIVTNGEDENRVFYIDFDWSGDSMPYDTQMDFLTWKERPEAAIAKSIRVPKEAMPQFYEPLRHLLYTMENGSELITGMSSSYYSVLMRCMAECPQMRVGDILAFLKKDGLTERDQQDAFYYMGQAPDMQEHLEPFIAAMEQGSYWVAHAALQAVSRLRSEKLHPVLLKMWEKYRKDDCMRSNLKVAFETNGIPIPSK